MGYEVDFQAVGEGERSGDAIALRYGNLNGPRAEQTLITIDGGTLECGDKLVEHVRNLYRTNIVDIAFLSHPDTDHASGMRCVLQEMQVKQVAMHLPWNHSTDVHELLDDDRVTPNSIRDRTKRNLAAAREIEALARKKGIEVVEPFAGARNNNRIVVLGPTKEFYQRMLAGFKFMPGVETNEAPMILAKYLKMLGERAVNWIQEHWSKETLLEPADDATKPENNSSVIFMLETEGKKLVFTGDAGVLALESGADFAEANGISLANITFFDVPLPSWANIDVERNEIRFIAGKTSKRMLLPIAEPLRQQIAALPASDDPKAPLHPRAHEILQRPRDGISTLSAHFGDLLGRCRPSNPQIREISFQPRLWTWKRRTTDSFRDQLPFSASHGRQSFKRRSRAGSSGDGAHWP